MLTIFLIEFTAALGCIAIILAFCIPEKPHSAKHENPG
jgi:hypothetical protein